MKVVYLVLFVVVVVVAVAVVLVLVLLLLLRSSFFLSFYFFIICFHPFFLSFFVCVCSCTVSALAGVFSVPVEVFCYSVVFYAPFFGLCCC